ncbi:hypothetical protein J27TS8_40170 [Robertmurraya siralis]|uniref:Uncharacterized protein n=1 Tax=Robertmurraya siralis TaxID=77777 RepID=A0A920BVD5_9BACI|nr:hypothetical protein J27TS8_40170 [Robertmurraya siralis]
MFLLKKIISPTIYTKSYLLSHILLNNITIVIFSSSQKTFRELTIFSGAIYQVDGVYEREVSCLNKDRRAGG